MPAVIRNEAETVIASAQKASEAVQHFAQLGQQFANLAAGGTGLEGAAQNAFAAAGQRVADATRRAQATAQPRIDAVRESAHASSQIGDEGANALNSVDISL